MKDNPYRVAGNNGPKNKTPFDKFMWIGRIKLMGIALFVTAILSVFLYLIFVVAPQKAQDRNNRDARCEAACQGKGVKFCNEENVICYLPGQYIKLKKNSNE